VYDETSQMRQNHTYGTQRPGYGFSAMRWPFNGMFDRCEKPGSLGAPLRGRHRDGRRGAGVRMLIGAPRGLHNRASDKSSFTPTKQ